MNFRDMQRQIFFADLVIVAGDAALEDQPEPFNLIRLARLRSKLLT
jgi:hypothetical protein